MFKLRRLVFFGVCFCGMLRAKITSHFSIFFSFVVSKGHLQMYRHHFSGSCGACCALGDAFAKATLKGKGTLLDLHNKYLDT